MARNYVNATGVRNVRDTLIDFPRPDRMASEAIRRWAGENGTPLDPDRIDAVTLHYQRKRQGNWVGVITQKMTLTQALLANWQGESNNNVIGAAFGAPWAGTFPPEPITLVDALDTQGVFHYGDDYFIFNGLFHHSTPQRYSAQTHVEIRAEDFQRFIWDLDFHTAYKQTLDRYWETHFDAYRIAAKINFITACNKQVSEGSLSDAGRRLAWQAAGLERPGTKADNTPAVQARALNVYGYTATDLICLTDHISGLTLLYVPGNASPLHEFASERQMRKWFARQCRDAQKHAALVEHFALPDRSNGLSFSGVDTALSGLGSYPMPFRLDSNRPGFTTVGVWPAQKYVNYKAEQYSPWFDEDLFLTLAKRQKQRSHRDADFIITSDHEVNKAKWRGYLYSAMNVLAPLALVVPELAPLFLAGGVSQFGLGLDQAINARHPEQQAEGVDQAIFGALNALPGLQEIIEKSPQLFSVKGNQFVSPSLVDGKRGYLLSPVRPPRFLEPEVAESFEFDEVVRPFPEGDPSVAGAVIRLIDFKRCPDQLQATVGGYLSDVAYDLERNAFVLEEDLNEINPVYYRAPQAPATELTPVTGDVEPVTDQARTRTLRALGIDLQLPVDYAPQGSPSARPIPKVVMHIWVGDKVIEPDLVSNLAHNAERLRGSGYAHRLYLSGASEQAYAQNFRNLSEQANGLEILTLEDQPFFKDFMQSPYYEQYQAAMTGHDGQGTTYASAVDILRYRLLHHEGGLYMDVDDSFLAKGEYPLQVNGRNFGIPGEDIRDVDLRTTDEGLLLCPPVSHQTLAMRVQYNTNMIGSHPGNPTLDMISEEIRARFQQLPDFYRSKPDPEFDKAGFERFARQLCWLTGPRVLNDVVDRTLPALYKLRQTSNLIACPTLNRESVIDWAAFEQAKRTYLPLTRIAKTGHNQSWFNA